MSDATNIYEEKPISIRSAEDFHAHGMQVAYGQGTGLALGVKMATINAWESDRRSPGRIV